MRHPHYDIDLELLIGHTLEEAADWLAEFSLKLRIYEYESLITADYDQDRLNVEAPDNIITKIIGFG